MRIDAEICRSSTFASVFFVVAAIFAVRNLQPIDLPEPSSQSASADDCIVSEEAARVHSGEKGFENARIWFVNEDNTVQVQTFETKLSILFELKPDKIECFNKGWITPVTIVECEKVKRDECDFSLPHTVYVRTEPVSILNWEYAESAPN